MQSTPKSPSLEAHQNALKIIYSWTTPEQFDTASELLKEKRFEILKPTQIATLLWVAENQRKLYASKSTPITVAEVSTPEPSRVQAIAEEYKEIDEEQFGAEEVILSVPKDEEVILSVPQAEEVILSTPVSPQEEIITTSNTNHTPIAEESFTPASDGQEPVKRKRRTASMSPEEYAKQVGMMNTHKQLQWVQSVTVSRRVNLPIEWVQYSNNEFNVSVTASSKEDAVNELNTLLESFLADQWLVRKSIADKTIADLKTQIKAEQEKKVTPPAPVQPTWDPELLKRHEKLRDMMNFIYKNSTNKEEFIALKDAFTKL